LSERSLDRTSPTPSPPKPSRSTSEPYVNVPLAVANEICSNASASTAVPVAKAVAAEECYVYHAHSCMHYLDQYCILSKGACAAFVVTEAVEVVAMLSTTDTSLPKERPDIVTVTPLPRSWLNAKPKATTD
jgi:hypothetical protein